MTYNPNILEQRHKIELLLMRFDPEKYVPLLIKSISDMYKHRYDLRQIIFTEESFLYLLNITIGTIEQKKRFRTLDTLQSLKIILRDRAIDKPLTPEILNKLFFLYTTYISHRTKDVQWAVNTFLKDVILSDDQIQWLLANCENNILVLNRILRYPSKNELIETWATQAYLKGKYRNRLSEIMAILIREDIPNFLNNESSVSLLWAIYYSQINTAKKRQLLSKTLNSENLDTYLEICTRLSFVDLLEATYHELDNIS